MYNEITIKEELIMTIARTPSLLINKQINLKSIKENNEVVGQSKRIWLEGRKLLKFFNVNDMLKIIDTESGIFMRPATNEEVEESKKTKDNSVRKVCGRKNRNTQEVDKAVIEINECNSVNLKNMNDDEMLRIIVKENQVSITVNQNTVAYRKEQRESEVKRKVINGEKLVKGSIFAGGGTMDFSGSDGFKLAGLASVVRLALDFDEDCTDNLMMNLGHVFDEKSLVIQSDITLLNLGNTSLPKLDILSITPPCVDASPAGKAKKGNALETSKTAHLVYYYSQIIDRCNPAIIMIENVPNFRNSISYHVLTSLLSQLGYDMQLRIIDANKDGFSLETRERMFLTAISSDLGIDFDMNNVTPLRQCAQTLGECLDPKFPLNSKSWSPKTGLIAKEKRDKEAGKGFRMQTYTPESDKIGTLRAGYAKSGTSDPLVIHPTPELKLFRLLTPVEHSRVKEIRKEFIAGIEDNATMAHKILGNGLSGMISESWHYALGVSLLKLKDKNQPLETRPENNTHNVEYFDFHQEKKAA